MLKKWKKEKGQTLVEAILAIAVILIALVGFLSQSLYLNLAGSETSQRKIALNLAREGVEVVRNVRDSNWLSGQDWDQGLLTGVFDQAVIDFDSDFERWDLFFVNETLDQCVVDQSCQLSLGLDGVYSHNVMEDPTGFYRLLEFEEVCADGPACFGEVIGLKVVSRVRWEERDGWRNVELEEVLYNWKE